MVTLPVSREQMSPKCLLPDISATVRGVPSWWWYAVMVSSPAPRAVLRGHSSLVRTGFYTFLYLYIKLWSLTYRIPSASFTDSSSFDPGGFSMVKFWRMAEVKRKNIIRASDSPGHNRRPVVKLSLLIIWSLKSLLICTCQGLLYHRTCKPDFLCSWPMLNSYLK